MMRAAAILVVLLAAAPASAANLCISLDLGGFPAVCATPTNAEITDKLLPAYKPLCDRETGNAQVPPVTDYSCTNAEVWNYFGKQILRGTKTYIQNTLTNSARDAVAPVTVSGFPQ